MALNILSLSLLLDCGFSTANTLYMRFYSILILYTPTLIPSTPLVAEVDGSEI